MRAPERSGRPGGRPGSSRQRQPRAAPGDRGGFEAGPPARRGGHLVPGAGHRHGGRRPGGSGGGPSVHRLGPAAGGARRARGGPDLPRRPLPQMAWGSAELRRGRRGHARRGSRKPAHPVQSAGRAGPAGGGHGGAGGLGCRGARQTDPPGGSILQPPPGGLGGRAGHVGRALSFRRVLRASSSTELGPPGGAAQRQARGRSAGPDQRRHHPRPGDVWRLPGGRGRFARGRTGRGDGARVSSGRRVCPGGFHLAHRGDHRGPGPGDPRARPAGAHAFLAG